MIKQHDVYPGKFGFNSCLSISRAPDIPLGLVQPCINNELLFADRTERSNPFCIQLRPLMLNGDVIQSLFQRGQYNQLLQGDSGIACQILVVISEQMRNHSGAMNRNVTVLNTVCLRFLLLYMPHSRVVSPCFLRSLRYKHEGEPQRLSLWPRMKENSRWSYICQTKFVIHQDPSMDSDDEPDPEVYFTWNEMGILSKRLGIPIGCALLAKIHQLLSH